jgi:hypothetical protein
LPNPNIQQGTLNRIRGSLSFVSYPNLNITAPYLGRNAIRIVFQGAATQNINTMTGTVPSPEPYMVIEMTVDLIKTQAFAQQFMTQIGISSFLGDCTLRGDANPLQPFFLQNVSVLNPGDLNFDGTSTSLPLRFGGYWEINSALFT